MKLKTLLKVLRNVEVELIAESGYLLDNLYIDNSYFIRNEETAYDDMRVLQVTTNKDCDTLFVYVKNN